MSTVTTNTAIALSEYTDQTITVTGPFHPRTTLIKPSHFPSPFDAQGDDEYQFVTRVDGHIVGVRASFAGTAPDQVRLQLYAPDSTAAVDPRPVIAELSHRLGLDLALPGYADLAANDPVLSRLPPAMLGARPSSPWTLYEYLTIGTVLQNTTVARTVKMAGNLAARLGTAYEFPDGTVLTGFWNPAAVLDVGETALRDLSLGYRAKTLVRAADDFHADPDLEARLRADAGDTDRLRAGLMGIYGVGKATTGYLMFDVFKAVDELTHLPPWEAKIFGQLLFGDQDTPAAVSVEYCHQRWAPYTMLAAHAVFETVFWARSTGQGPQWLDPLIRL